MSDPPTMPLATRFGISSKPASRELTSAGTSAHSRLFVQVTGSAFIELSWESEFASMSDLPCSRQRTTKIHLAEIGL